MRNHRQALAAAVVTVNKVASVFVAPESRGPWPNKALKGHSDARALAVATAAQLGTTTKSATRGHTPH